MTDASVSKPGRRRKDNLFSQEVIVLLVTLGLGVLFAVTLPGFATLGNLLTMSNSVAILGILSLGMGVVVIGRGLDLSQITAMAVSAAIVCQMIGSGFAIPVALLAGLAVALAIGIANGLIIAFIEIPALFTTLASGLLVYGLARITVLDGFISYIPNGNDGFLFVGQGRFFGVPMPVIVFILLAILVHLMLSRTSVGRFVYAHGDNADTARLTGIPVRPLTVFEYSVCSVIGFLAGLVMAAMNASMNTQVINSTLIFDVILVVVLGGISLVGGRGSVLSVIVGAALIGTLLNGMIIMNLDSNLQSIIKGLVLLGAILLDNFLHPRDEETARQGD
ncbi:ABC transporter permease [Ruegeria sp. WL0004]|uniref:ABC transporter permease n=1 Tax=Ruegeria marisflavi TaxID=2984152 RepID=A0ABT2WWK5_9RHOB|nr:ABC transporter permease [Ruegeria sp. WL0004]MCU9840272.1 ABC transporter permease [Ruegeria sp. WL0004]